MASASGQVAGVVMRGWSPRQHHDPDWALSQRIVTYSCRAVRSDTAKGGDDDLAPQYEDGTLGDDLCWTLWEPANRATGGWSVSWPTTVSGSTTRGVAPCFQRGKRKTRPRRRATGSAELLPLKGPGDPDRTFEPKDPSGLLPSWAGPWPEDWTGILHGGTDHEEQQETWHPDFLGLVAPTKAGDPEHGTRVYDTDATGRIDPKRWREITSLISVVEVGNLPCVPAGFAVALNLGRGGSLDVPAKPGYMPIADWDVCEIGYAGWKFGSGPLIVNDGGKTCQHNYPPNPQGIAQRPLHLATKAHWLWPDGGGEDGPLHFTQQRWDNGSRDEGTFWRTVHLVWDPEGKNEACKGAKGQFFGNWKWQVRDSKTQIPIEEPPPPPPPQPPPWPPWEPPPWWPPPPDPPPKRPPRVCQPGDVSTPRYPAGGQCDAGPGRIGLGRSARRGDTDWTGWPGGSPDPIPDVTGGSGKPLIQVVGDPIVRAAAASLANSPLVSEQATVGRGCTEGADGFRQQGTRVRGHPTTSGGDAYVPWGPVKFAELVEGAYDLPCGGSTPPGVTPVIQYYPGGLSKLAFCHPRDRDVMYGAGAVLQSGATAFTVDAVDCDGATTGDGISIPFDGSGTSIDGTPVTSLGGTTSFGGDGSDGAVSITANTQASAVAINATTFTLGATYSYYPAAGSALELFATGAATINGTLLLAGKSVWASAAGSAGTDARVIGGIPIAGNSVAGVDYPALSGAASAGGGSGGTGGNSDGLSGDTQIGGAGRDRGYPLITQGEVGGGGTGGGGAVTSGAGAGTAGNSASNATDFAARTEVASVLVSSSHVHMILGGSPGGAGTGGTGGVDGGGNVGTPGTGGAGGAAGTGSGTDEGNGSAGSAGTSGSLGSGDAPPTGAGGGGGGGRGGGYLRAEIAGTLTYGGSSVIDVSGGNGGAGGAGANGLTGTAAPNAGGGGAGGGGGGGGCAAIAHVGAKIGSPTETLAGGTGGTGGAGGTGGSPGGVNGGAGGAGGDGEDGYIEHRKVSA